MRQFVIVRPGLSAGPPGTVVTGEALAMDDDQLDEWQEAGWGVEVHQAVAPNTAGPVDVGPVDAAEPVPDV